MEVLKYHRRACPAYIPEAKRTLHWYKAGECLCEYGKLIKYNIPPTVQGYFIKVHEDEECMVVYSDDIAVNMGFEVLWRNGRKRQVKQECPCLLRDFLIPTIDNYLKD